jgi:lysozyme
MVVSEEEATRILIEVDIPHFWNAIKDGIKVPLTPHQKGALLLLSYNIGNTAFLKSSVLKYLNEGNYVKAATAFLMWNKSEGKVLDGLTLRRAEEVVLFRHGWWEHK